MPVAQPEALLARVRSRLETKAPAELTVLHAAASLTASLVIPLALTEGRLTADEAFEAGFVDEIYQTRRVRKDKVIMEKLDAARAELAALQQFMYLMS
jgi:chaperone required for assembly of F1-ATPase